MRTSGSWCSVRRWRSSSSPSTRRCAWQPGMVRTTCGASPRQRLAARGPAGRGRPPRDRRVQGSTADVARVTALTKSMRKLETAYLAYRKNVSAPDRDKSATELSAMLDEVTSERFGASEPGQGRRVVGAALRSRAAR